MGAYWKMIPCLGGRAPVFNVLNSAFSAPRTCKVLAAILATWSSPPAMEISLAERMAPRTVDMFGATSAMILSVYFSAVSRNLYSWRTVPQTSLNHSMSGAGIWAPADFSAASEIPEALSSGIPSFTRFSWENESRVPRFWTRRAYVSCFSTSRSSSGK